jgi:FlaA1/EpsC-like NDP-sugar epimerase
MGALIAGVSIANSPYTEEIVARISSIRDFFVTLFFVSLGLKIPLVGFNIFALSLFLIFVSTFSRFLTVVFYYKFLKTGIRPLFITSINLFPISEFALVISTLGLKYLHISENIVILILVTMISSSIISPYLINYNHNVYMFFAKIFKFEERDVEFSSKADSADVLILGYNMIARDVISSLKRKFEDLKVVVADFNVENKKVVSEIGGKWVYVDFSVYDSLKRLEHLKPKVIILPLLRVFLKGITPEALAFNLKSIFGYSSIIFLSESDEDKESFLRYGIKVINISEITSSRIRREIVNIMKKERVN